MCELLQPVAFELMDSELPVGGPMLMVGWISACQHLIMKKQRITIADKQHPH